MSDVDFHLREARAWAETIPDYATTLEEVSCTLPAIAHALIALALQGAEPEGPSDAQNSPSEAPADVPGTEVPPTPPKPSESPLEARLRYELQRAADGHYELQRAADDHSEHHSQAEWGTIKRLVNVHSPILCVGRPCVVHNPTQHHMRQWALLFRNDRGIFERICVHGIAHPDPDQFDFWEETNQMFAASHGCDGCCVP